MSRDRVGVVYEVGQADSWREKDRERETVRERSGGQPRIEDAECKLQISAFSLSLHNMLNVVTKGILVCQAFVNVQLMGF